MKCLNSEEIRADLPVRMAFFTREAESKSWDEMLAVNKAIHSNGRLADQRTQYSKVRRVLVLF